MNLYLTGGTLRDHLLKRPTGSDYDFAVEADSYEQMRDELVNKRGMRVWQERPEFVCVRGQVDLGNLGSFGGLLPSTGRVDADFTLCRSEAMYSDKRHPDTVTPTSLHADLGRRDFTVNALAVSESGVWFDAFGGRSDAANHVLRCVGHPVSRFTEDPLRMLRAVRFSAVYNLWWDWEVAATLSHYDVVDLLSTLPHERVREELNKALAHDWRATMLKLLVDAPRVGEALSRHFPGLWLKATTEAR